MNNSILLSMKKLLLGSTADTEFYDMDIIMHINSVFMILNQLGVGPRKTFIIKDESSLWTDFITDDDELEAVKTYMYLKVRSIFDPPSGAAAEASKHLLEELEWRLNSRVDYEQNGG